MEALPASHFRSRVCLYFQDRKGVRRSCNRIMLDKILDAVARGDTCLSLSGMGSRWGNASYKCDLQKMKLVNIKTLVEEDIFMEFQWDPKSLISIVGQNGERMIARKVLVMALERFRRTPNLRKILILKGVLTCEIKQNPYLCPGHPPHDNFVESLLDCFEKEINGSLKESPLFEHFLESAADDTGAESFDAVERGGIRTVFHGTNHAVMDAILLSGLDPNCRSHGLREDYFGVGPGVSLEFTKQRTGTGTRTPLGSLKLLIFMVLNPVEKAWKDFGQFNGSSIVTVSSNKFELPIAEITLPKYNV